MTTDTKAVARFDLWGFDGFMQPQPEGEFIRFTDYEEAVDEWKRLADEARRNALNAESNLAASRAEVEGLRAVATELRQELRENALDNGQEPYNNPSANSVIDVG